MKRKYKTALISAIVLQSYVVIAACAPSGKGSNFQGADYPVATVGVSPKLISISDLQYAGAFVLPADNYGESSMNWAEGVMEVNGDSMFIVGHDHDNAIAEFKVPKLVNSTRLADLNSSGPPIQPFNRVLTRLPDGNPEKLDQIVGLEYVNGSLIVNAIEYYDAPADNKRGTFVVDQANNMTASRVSEVYAMSGRTRASGWLSNVPQEWRYFLRASHISGASSGGPIISRHSVGPSAFAVNLADVVTAGQGAVIPTMEMLGYALDRPLEADLFNDSGNNKMWTHISQARYGFIVPGTSTYMTLGKSGGHESGVGYKVTQDDGNLCGGYCSRRAADNYNYYWLWDMRQMYKVAQGELPPDQIKPYEHGKLNLPFQAGAYVNYVGGASFDETRNLLYISILKANTSLGQFSNPPVVVAFQLGG